MHIEFIDLLRCPVEHEDSWLVAAVTKMEGRLVIEAKLGCPVCNASYLVTDGVALFDGSKPTDDLPAAELSASQTAADFDDPVIVSAYLNLTGPEAVALLTGDWARTAEEVAVLVGARLISLNAEHPTHRLENVAEIQAAGRIPLAEKSLHGAALDAAHSTPSMIQDVVRLLRPRGRLVVAAAAQLPPQFRELARDADNVVAEYVGELVPLRR